MVRRYVHGAAGVDIVAIAITPVAIADANYDYYRGRITAEEFALELLPTRVIGKAGRGLNVSTRVDDAAPINTRIVNSDRVGPWQQRQEVDLNTRPFSGSLDVPVGSAAESTTRARVLANIAESRGARLSSNFSEHAAREAQLLATPRSWAGARAKYWRDRGSSALPGEFSPTDLSLMAKGRAPRHPTIDVPMELHHKVPQRSGGSNAPFNLQEVWPWEHDAIDPFRNYTGPRP